MTIPELDKDFDMPAAEKRSQDLWKSSGIYNYDANSSKETFSVDTPPPYVSAAHLHVGHAMSYTQAEILVRYKRMQGFNIFYPMGFDDNGLPTERYVEKLHNVNKKRISRSDFRKLCIEETQKGAVTYEHLWRSLGLSVDWNLRYSTIDDHCRHTAQKSFLDLYNKGLLYRSNEPVLWDTVFETALAQADLETIQRKGVLYDIAFSAESDGTPLVISTTRPELIPACVGLFFNPKDERYAHLKGAKAVVPIAGHTVPILTSEDVEVDFGTGLMMVCTFGDGEDVKKWKEHKLETRMCLNPDGKMNELAGAYEGKTVPEARKAIVKDLQEKGVIQGQKSVDQAVSVGERSEQPVEFIMAPQWFINVLEHKEKFYKRAQQLNWFPDYMKVRLEHWIDGLKYDWNISRQRFYGVPFPIWYVEETGEVIVADEADLPIDPLESAPPKWAQEKYAGKTIVPEADVMETWMTSSLTPLVNSNWVEDKSRAGNMQMYPMSLRVQAFEIIRTWLFYTLVKSEFHTESLPWKDVMISGWGLNENGKKISKRDLEKYTDADGYNRYDPDSLIQRYGADALRYWAASSQLGKDLRFNERDVKDGRKIVVKLWNVARLASMYLQGFKPKEGCIPVENRPVEDQWLLNELNIVTKRMTECFEKYDYATAKETLHKFFWMTYCDTYLELIKTRFWENSDWSEEDKQAGQQTLYESLRTLLSLFAPFLPHVTEEIYQQFNKFDEEYSSLHISAWPKVEGGDSIKNQKDMDIILAVLSSVRKLRTEQKLGATTPLQSLVLASDDDQIKAAIQRLEIPLKSAARAQKLEIAKTAETITDVKGLTISIIAQPQSEAA